ncbi:MAG: GIY-YIG nuclease family protein [Armatimonadetes bacterium]|nr:GIY-YIG nuclease family protein [Armatimonadota bacterium]
MTPGVYHLVLQLREPQCVRVGSLGTYDFPAGYYVYTGSALNGLEARIARHRRHRKTLRWHVDYLLPTAEIVRVVELPTRAAIECRRNQGVLAMTGARVVVRKFGASDCHCESHLAYFGDVCPDLSDC